MSHTPGRRPGTPTWGGPQLESGAIQGLSAALKEKLAASRGVIEQGSFGDYPYCV